MLSQSTNKNVPKKAQKAPKNIPKNIPKKISKKVPAQIPGEITIYTDGACKRNGKAGYGVHFPNKEFEDLGNPFTHKPITNQRAELYAIYKALRTVEKSDGKKFRNVHIYSDSQYGINSLTKWISGWIKNDWKTANKKPVCNVDIIKKIHAIMEKYPGKIRFTHVLAHTGRQDAHSIGNDMADKLANIGALGEEGLDN